IRAEEIGGSRVRPLSGVPAKGSYLRLAACVPTVPLKKRVALVIKSAFRAAFVLTSTVAMTAGLMSVPANAAPGAQARIAALPTCDHFSVRKVQKGTVRFPSVGADTKQTNCKLQYGNHNWGVVALQQWLLYCNGAKQ